MILSNIEIAKAIREKRLIIGNYSGNEDPSQPPFNTSAIDLQLSSHISIPRGGAVGIDLRRGGISELLTRNSISLEITPDQPYSLDPNKFT